MVVVALIVLYTYGKSVNCHVQSSRIADSLSCTLHPSSPVYYAIHIGLLVCITRSVSASADRVAVVKLSSDVELVAWCRHAAKVKMGCMPG